METDEFLQQMVKTQFKQCTVLTIAHRLNTIMESDDVLVLAAGAVAEYDHPALLLRGGGTFAQLVAQTGKKNAEFLQGKAAKHFDTFHMQRTPRSLATK
jgi:ABC-type multidrug transport system fused ATPase/permease subunit